MTVQTLDTAPHAPPVVAEASAEPRGDAGRKHGRAALLSLAASLGISVITAVVMIAADRPWPGVLGFGAAAVLGLIGLVRGIVALVQIACAPSPASWPFTGAVAASVLANGFMALVGPLAAFL